jgi:hypothetical protein
VDVYVTLGADDSIVATETMKTCAHAPHPFGGGILSGDTGLTVPEGVKGAVQMKGPDGAMIQAKF